MGKQVYATLMEWQLKQAIERNDWADAYQDSGRVFTYDDGEQLRPGYPSSAMMTIVKNAGLPPLSSWSASPVRVVDACIRDEDRTSVDDDGARVDQHHAESLQPHGAEFGPR